LQRLNPRLIELDQPMLTRQPVRRLREALANIRPTTIRPIFGLHQQQLDSLGAVLSWQQFKGTT
jgi:hypothetical protein